MSQEKKPAAVQIHFDDVSRIRTAADHLDYWLNLPLPTEVTQSPVHQERHHFLAQLRTIFLTCHEKYTSGDDPIGPQFGSGGSIQQGPPNL